LKKPQFGSKEQGQSIFTFRILHLAPIAPVSHFHSITSHN